MTSAQVTPVSVWTVLRRRLGRRRTAAAMVAALAVLFGAVVFVGKNGAATASDAGPVPRALVPVLVEAARSCPTLTAPRLAGQAMAASGLDPSDPMGIAGLTDAAWTVWAPWTGALRSDARASILGLAHFTCDLVGHVRVAGVPGDQWRLAVAASQLGLDEVVSSGGVPSAVRTYVDRVAAYAAEYALQPEFANRGLGDGGAGARATPGVSVAAATPGASTIAKAGRPSAPPAATAPPGPVFVAPMGAGSSSGNSISIGRVVGKDGKCLHVDPNRNAYHAPVQISRCDGSVGQTWSWRTDGTLRTLGYCLSSVDHGRQEATLLQLDACTGTLDQVWNPNYTKTFYNTGSAYCLDVPFGNTTDGTQLRIWACNRTDSQIWSFTPGAINGQIRSPITDGACLEVGGPNTVGGRVARVGLCTANSTQRWTIGVDATLRSGGLCLEVTGQTELSAGAPGTAVGVNTCTRTRSQTWAPQPDGSLQNPISHLCLSAPAGAVKLGATLRIERCVDGIARQHWALPVLDK